VKTFLSSLPKAVKRNGAVVARRKLRVLRHQAQRLLPRQALLALDVPAVCKGSVVFTDQLGRRLMRRMAGTQRQPGEPWRVRRIGGVVGDHADGLVHQVGRQVVAAGVSAGRIDMGVVAHQLGRVLVGLGVHEAVEAVEATAQRPAVEGAGRAALRQRRDMPLAHHVVAEAVRPQHLGQRAGLARDLAAVAGVAAVEVGQAAHAHRMMVAPGEQRGARGAAHRRGVKAAVAQAAAGQRVGVRRADGRAVAAEVGKADIVEPDHQQVGGALRRA
jgi:hypothetical protein